MFPSLRVLGKWLPLRVWFLVCVGPARRYRAARLPPKLVRRVCGRVCTSRLQLHFPAMAALRFNPLVRAMGEC